MGVEWRYRDYDNALVLVCGTVSKLDLGKRRGGSKQVPRVECNTVTNFPVSEEEICSGCCGGRGSSGQLVGLRLREEEEVEEFGVFW